MSFNIDAPEHEGVQRYVYGQPVRNRSPEIGHPKPAALNETPGIMCRSYSQRPITPGGIF
jgi:hypothetical protein